MRKYWYRRILIMIVVFTIAVGGSYYYIELINSHLKEEVSVKSMETMVIPGGMPVGIYLETDGVMVLGTDVVKDKEGVEQEPSEHLVKSGDYIKELNGKEIHNKSELIEAIKHLETEEVVLKVQRKENLIDIKTKAIVCEKGEYKLGG